MPRERVAALRDGSRALIIDTASPTDDRNADTMPFQRAQTRGCAYVVSLPEGAVWLARNAEATARDAGTTLWELNVAGVHVIEPEPCGPCGPCEHCGRAWRACVEHDYDLTVEHCYECGYARGGRYYADA
jgi:hypothetical protein